MTPKQRAEMKKLSEAMFNFSLIALAAYRSDAPNEYTETLEESALELETVLARNNRWIKKMIPGGK